MPVALLLCNIPARINHPQSSLPDAETAGNIPPSPIAMPRKSKISAATSELFLGTVLSSRNVASCGANVHTVKLANNSLVSGIWSNDQLVPIGTEIAVQSYTKKDGSIGYRLA